ncbi:GNAT family N-acetyltransferase [Pontivivens insulae]|uniref:Ribosomal N-acetyltransferase YdaF n=1 Tax=Pontivivens insulae TaxID=1639689 RepID=A0A2R8A767_9RHOB|nr:GNAT family protein [Pontivivens insulae]RED18189.1 ribosomal-protein-alanine N-acetyltransferase [Pontivivens insulae]SPF28087.1 Putative ribosomal N-acetyltransferase YdaF [Pontivivens insulae]
MFGLGAKPRLVLHTKRLYLRPPVMDDHRDWVILRRDGAAFLDPWEPVRSRDHLSVSAFRSRVRHAAQAIKTDRAVPLFLFARDDDRLLGAITLDNIQRGPARYATVGYWIGEPFAQQGYMSEALSAVVDHAHRKMALGRVQAGCLPENKPSQRLLEKCGFAFEGYAQSYLQIAGQWRTHCIYAHLDAERRSADRLPGKPISPGELLG